MIPASFEQSNHVMARPDSMAVDECDPLSVCLTYLTDGAVVNNPVTVSCWKLTKGELEEINRTGRVWLLIFGHGMPPVVLQTADPFTVKGIVEHG